MDIGYHAEQSNSLLPLSFSLLFFYSFIFNTILYAWIGHLNIHTLNTIQYRVILQYLHSFCGHSTHSIVIIKCDKGIPDPSANTFSNKSYCSHTSILKRLHCSRFKVINWSTKLHPLQQPLQPTFQHFNTTTSRCSHMQFSSYNF